MHRFAISYMSYYDGEIFIGFVTADDEVEALNKWLRGTGRTYEGETGFEECTTLEDAVQRALDGDLNIGVRVVPENDDA